MTQDDTTTDNERTGRMLSPEMLYPPCDECGTNVFVDRIPHKSYTFKCYFCGAYWYDEEFTIVFGESGVRRRIYILHRYGGYDYDQIAITRTASEAAELYAIVREKVADRAAAAQIDRGVTA